jgi:hypothetical protein
MKTLVELAIGGDIFFMLVLVDLLVHFKDNKRKAFILRVLKARKQMEDEYGIDAPGARHVKIEETDKHPHRGSRKDRREKDQEHEAWIADLTTNERALIELYSDDTTVMIHLPAQEVM